MFNQIMVDIEALDSNAETAAVVSIGAVKFSFATLSLGDTFYMEIADHGLKDQLGRGRTMSLDTMIWWMCQSDQAREVLMPPVIAQRQPRYNTPAVLDAFRAFVKDASGVWGNGVTYDNITLRELYKTYNQSCPWRWNADRCYRTYKNVHGDRAALERSGTHHNALDDAITQAKHLLAMYKALTKKSK